jgi:superfamily II DNA/RNA helicase
MRHRRKAEESTIVYCATIRDAVDVCIHIVICQLLFLFFLTLMFLQVQKILLAQGTKAALYHGKMGQKERTDSHMYVLGQ